MPLQKKFRMSISRVESEVGIKIDELKAKWDRITRARTLVSEAKDDINNSQHEIGD